MAAQRKSHRKPSGRSLVERTPLAEWTAAGVGLALTLGVLGFSLWEAVTAANSVPALSLEAGAPAVAGGGFVVPVTLRNDSDATAAAVRIRGVLELDGRAVETRHATFDYAPGNGEVRGGLVFQRDPARLRLRLSVDGFQEP